MGIKDRLELAGRFITDKRFRHDYKALKYAADGYVHYCVEKLEDLQVLNVLEEERGATVEDILVKTDIEHEELLELMLNILVGSDMLVYEDGVYRIDQIEDTFTDRQFEWLEEYYPYSTEFTMTLLEHSEEVLKTGKPVDETGFEGDFMTVWDNMMDEFPYSFKKMMVRKMFSDVEEGDRILDLGCGSGSLIEMMVRDIDKDICITGVDMSEDSLEIADERLHEMRGLTDSETRKRNIDRVELEQCDLRNTFPEGGKYDYVITSLVFHHIPKEERADLVRNIADTMNSGGMLGIYEFLHPSKLDPLPFWLMHCVPTHKSYPYRDEFLSVLERDFSNVRTYAADTVIIAEK